MSKTKKLCACGHIHELETGWTLYEHRDRHEQPIAATYLDRRDNQFKPAKDCACGNGHFVDAAKYERFKKEHAAYLAKLETPEEQAKIAAELARMRAIRENPKFESASDTAMRLLREDRATRKPATRKQRKAS